MAQDKSIRVMIFYIIKEPPSFTADDERNIKEHSEHAQNLFDAIKKLDSRVLEQAYNNLYKQHKSTLNCKNTSSYFISANYYL